MSQEVKGEKEEHKQLSIAVRDATTFEECQKAYDVWSDRYDKSSLELLGFPAAEKSAEIISREFGQGEGINVLDVGTGEFVTSYRMLFVTSHKLLVCDVI